MDPVHPWTPANLRLARFAMTLSLAAGALMLVGKSAAYLLTGSAAILSDAAESVVHIVAVAFAAFSLWLSVKPPNHRFPYGYERIAFFSAGFEGAMIVIAAIYIIQQAVSKWMAGIPLQRLSEGTLMVFGASAINAALGVYLVYAGRRTRSLILEANGKHVLTDSWTSAGVLLGLLLVMITGWKPFDPIAAIVTALNILWSGFALMKRSLGGLMDYSDPRLGGHIRTRLDQLCAAHGADYHGVRFRNLGYRTQIELHLLFPAEVSLGDAHRRATAIEEGLESSLETPVVVITHLESQEDHTEVHREAHWEGRPPH